MKSLRSISINNKAFLSANSFELTELETLDSIEIDNDCLNSVFSFAVNGRCILLKRTTGLPQLQSVKLGKGAFRGARSLRMSNLTSLQSIEFGSDCFYEAYSFSLIGIIGIEY